MSNPERSDTGLYLHIPFCRQACHYCNFHFSTTMNNRQQLIEALLKEMDLVPGKQRQTFRTVYFGGGTPSILTAGELERLTTGLQQNFHIQDPAEHTLEINPDDVDEEKPFIWKELGFNRLSMGIQSFRDEDLQWMNRSHSAQQAIDALTRVRKAGFENLNIDLIYGLPGLSDEAWEKQVRKAMDLRVPHISAYALTVEPKTALHHLVEKKKHPDVDPEQQARQFLMLTELLESAGYEHYEISNFALPGFRSGHNSSYWSGIPYVGLGPGAHSYDGQARYWNVANNQQYIDAIGAGRIPNEKEELTPAQRINEYIMIRLRTSDGLDLSVLKKEWEPERLQAWVRSAEKFVDRGMMSITDEQMVLTRAGRLFADGIAAELFVDEPECL